MTQDTPTVEEIVRTLAMALTHSEQGHYDKNEALVRDTISPLVSNTETTNTMTQDTPTVEEIANKRGYFCVEEIVNEYFSTAPHYRGRRALKILLQEKVGTALETYGNARFEEGVKAERERVMEWAKKEKSDRLADPWAYGFNTDMANGAVETLNLLRNFLSDNK